MSTIPSIAALPALTSVFSWLGQLSFCRRKPSARQARFQALCDDVNEVMELAALYEKTSPSMAADLRAAATRALQD